MNWSRDKSIKAPTGRLQGGPGQRPGCNARLDTEPCRGGVNRAVLGRFESRLHRSLFFYSILGTLPEGRPPRARLSLPRLGDIFRYVDDLSRCPCRVRSGGFQRLAVFLLLPFLYFISGSLVPANANEVTTIELADPVYPKKPKRKHTLSAHLDAQGFPSGYSMEFINEVCLDDVSG